MLVIKEVTPLYDKIITTAEVFEDDVYDNGIIVYPKGLVKPYQKVVKTSLNNTLLKVGDLIMINPTKYIKKKYDNSIREDLGANPVETIDIPIVEIDGVNHFMITNYDVDYIISKFEEVEDIKPTNIAVDSKKLILPKKQKLVL